MKGGEEREKIRLLMSHYNVLFLTSKLRLSLCLSDLSKRLAAGLAEAGRQGALFRKKRVNPRKRRFTPYR